MSTCDEVIVQDAVRLIAISSQEVECLHCCWQVFCLYANGDEHVVGGYASVQSGQNFHEAERIVYRPPASISCCLPKEMLLLQSAACRLDEAWYDAAVVKGA